MSLKRLALISVAAFSFVSLFLLIQHELHSFRYASVVPDTSSKISALDRKSGGPSRPSDAKRTGNKEREVKTPTTPKSSPALGDNHSHQKPPNKRSPEEIEQQESLQDDSEKKDDEENKEASNKESTEPVEGNPDRLDRINEREAALANKYAGEKRGKLVCEGREVDSEVIYWKSHPGDDTYESPITPHHGIHHDRYVSFEYDQGGWNNVRMSLECILVLAHAMGRTLVVPPQQHLYLLGKTHKDKEDEKAHDEMGFEDFFDLDLLRSQKGLHIMTMEDFLAKEGVSGGLGELPPQNSSEIWGGKLWAYLKRVADETPMFMGRFVAFPDKVGNFTLPQSYYDTAHKRSHIRKYMDPKEPKSMLQRLEHFGGERLPVFYDEKLQQAHFIHFPADGQHRILQHHYAFAFFADPKMQSFYKRFIRDYMRYKDPIQCAGHELLTAVRKKVRQLQPENTNGDFYALHVRRGDFQFKEVKISAEDIVKNLRFPNGTAIIPNGSVVYLSTDDPDGTCVNCYVQRQPCTSYKSPKPVGCPEDTSWNAFKQVGWQLLFLNDFLKEGHLRDVNPNILGMVETIVCSRAKIFAGTYFSTFTGFIHRIRGYHGLGEDTYYHTPKHVFAPQNPVSVGHGFSREWRYGWTDDGGELI